MIVSENIDAISLIKPDVNVLNTSKWEVTSEYEAIILDFPEVMREFWLDDELKSAGINQQISSAAMKTISMKKSGFDF